MARSASLSRIFMNWSCMAAASGLWAASLAWNCRLVSMLCRKHWLQQFDMVALLFGQTLTHEGVKVK